MFVKLFRCPKCRRLLKARGELVRAKVVCPLCRAVFRLPRGGQLRLSPASLPERMNQFIARCSN
jgi:ribosomal protein S27E